MKNTYTLREMADAVAKWSGKAQNPGDVTFQRLKSLTQAGAVVGHKPPGAGRTTARRFSLGEACYAGLLTVLGDFIMAGQHGVNMRDGFFSEELDLILESIRQGEKWTATLCFAEHPARGPIVHLALHLSDEIPDWTQNLEAKRTDSLGRVLFDAQWDLSGELPSLLAALEKDSE